MSTIAPPLVEYQISHDIVLWTSFKDGNLEAYEELYRQYYPKLVQYGYKIVQDIQRTEDAIHDVFVDLWRRREFLAVVDNPKFYLFKSLRNQLLRNQRHDLHYESLEIDHFLDLLVSLSAEQKTITLETEAELIERVQKAITSLSPRQQEVIHLRFYSGLSVEEISALMQITNQSVHNLLSRTYAVLRLTIAHILGLLFVTLFHFL